MREDKRRQSNFLLRKKAVHILKTIT